MKQTAMQIMLYDLKDKQLVYENSGMLDSATALVTSIELAEQLIQMEKEQMFEFWKGGQNSMEEHGKSFHQYHNNTYKQQDK